jgi:adenine-specific DNA methylase
MKDKISPIEAAKAFFDAKEWSGNTDALFSASLRYGKRIKEKLEHLEKQNQKLQRLHNEIRKEIECINEIVKK